MYSRQRLSTHRHRISARRAQIRGPALLFAALGDETRLLIVARLSAGGPMSIAGLTAGTGVTRQAVTKHLQVLSDAGLVHGHRAGRQTIWALEPEQLEAARQKLERISAQWDEALDSLKRYVER